MRRVALALTVLGILGVAAGQAQAYGPYYHEYHHAHYGPAFVHPHVYVAPRVVVPVTPAVVYPQPAYCPSVYASPCYTPVPRVGFYYRSRGLSLGIGW